jgi:hypothetical protein
MRFVNRVAEMQSRSRFRVSLSAQLASRKLCFGWRSQGPSYKTLGPIVKQQFHKCNRGHNLKGKPRIQKSLGDCDLLFGFCRVKTLNCLLNSRQWVFIALRIPDGFIAES